MNDVEPVEIAGLVSDSADPLDHLRHEHRASVDARLSHGVDGGEVRLQAVQGVDGFFVRAAVHRGGGDRGGGWCRGGGALGTHLLGGWMERETQACSGEIRGQ